MAISSIEKLNQHLDDSISHKINIVLNIAGLLRQKLSAKHPFLLTLNAINQLVDQNYRFKGLVLGSRSFQVDGVMSSPHFQGFLKEHPYMRITIPIKLDEVDNGDVKALLGPFSLLNNPLLYPQTLDINIVLTCPLARLLQADEDFLGTLSSLSKHFNNHQRRPIFSFNVDYNDCKLFEEFSDKIVSSLETSLGQDVEFVIQFLPEQMTGAQGGLIVRLQNLKDFLNDYISNENYKGLLLPIGEKDYHFFQVLYLNYSDEHLYISPFIYRPLNECDEGLRIKTIGPRSIIDKVDTLMRSQYLYSLKTHDCSDCSNLNSCVGKNVLSIMELKEIKECPFPSKVLNLLELM